MDHVPYDDTYEVHMLYYLETIQIRNNNTRTIFTLTFYNDTGDTA